MAMTNLRLEPDQRRRVIEKAAHSVASSDGILFINHKSVAKACSVPTSASNVRKYFGTKALLVKAAVDQDSTGLMRADARDQGFDV